MQTRSSYRPFPLAVPARNRVLLAVALVQLLLFLQLFLFTNTHFELMESFFHPHQHTNLHPQEDSPSAGVRQ